MNTATTTRQAKLEETRAKFLRLLDLERDSPEFERLFREVDAELDRLSREQSDAGR